MPILKFPDEGLLACNGKKDADTTVVSDEDITLILSSSDLTSSMIDPLFRIRGEASLTLMILTRSLMLRGRMPTRVSGELIIFAT